ncbi:3-deoxy-manno-octulosonate cytidylyltransferase [Alkalimonas sp.]|uniref:3-deoxy-manno-octulosonate cytidylyltransferase n=1 Tax=Alkalimonas sp. TaxID=1872453 RepID=UPI00263B8820|nr:3-deoxy-manno-octulosonate cytidylyltransferase [Alkalimonas sp.]MCC5824656.1 3-deoxy-manno-octulosonate cytidylyltransferase [Alkalimonas sp.]
MDFIVVIPARYASSRLPGKPLADIGGMPMVERVYRQALASGASRVVVATDDQRVADVVQGFAGEVCLTRAEHNSGTERLAEVVELLGLSDDAVVVNVQGDEPFIPPGIINQVATNLANQHLAEMATLAVALDDAADISNSNTVKVVCDQQGYALYFSRSAIPYDRDGQFSSQLALHYRRHIGIYAYRAGFIRRYVAWPMSVLEQIESLEQLRVLWQGEKIHVATALQKPPHGVDTEADLAAARAYCQQLDD